MKFFRNNLLKYRLKKTIVPDRDSRVSLNGFPFFERDTKLMFEQLKLNHFVVKVYLCVA
jgi:hypothetical protein